MSKRFRQLVFTVHSWLGVQLFFVLFLIMSSGTIAVFSNELDWLTREEVRATATNDPVSWQRVFDAVREAHPDHDIEQMTAPVEPGFAIEVLTAAPEGGKKRIYVDPATAEVQGTHGWITIQRFIRNLHMGLFLPQFGVLIVGSFAVFLLLTLITGLLTYRKFWRGFLKKPRRRDARTLMGDLHRLGGVWAIWFILLIGVTGVWYLVEDAVEYRWEAGWPQVEEVSAPPPRAQPHVPVALIEAQVARTWPGFEIDYITLPGAVSDPITVAGHAQALLVRSRANLIYLHPVTGEVIEVKDGRRISALERWIDTADPLHFGDFGGLAVKAIWFVFGLVLSFLSFSGFWLHLKRARRVAPAAQRRPARGTLVPA